MKYSFFFKGRKYQDFKFGSSFELNKKTFYYFNFNLYYILMIINKSIFNSNHDNNRGKSMRR